MLPSSVFLPSPGRTAMLCDTTLTLLPLRLLKSRSRAKKPIEPSHVGATGISLAEQEHASTSTKQDCYGVAAANV